MRCLGFCLGTQAAAYPAGRKLHRRKSWLSCWARSRPSTYATPFLRLRAGQQGPRSASHSGLPRPPRFPTHSALHTDGGAPVRRSVVAGSCSGCEKEEGRKPDLSRICQGSEPDRQKAAIQALATEPQILRCAPRSAKRRFRTLQSRGIWQNFG